MACVFPPALHKSSVIATESAQDHSRAEGLKGLIEVTEGDNVEPNIRAFNIWD